MKERRKEREEREGSAPVVEVHLELLTTLFLVEKLGSKRAVKEKELLLLPRGSKQGASSRRKRSPRLN
jgi:hypothetical protein